MVESDRDLLKFKTWDAPQDCITCCGKRLSTGEAYWRINNDNNEVVYHEQKESTTEWNICKDWGRDKFGAYIRLCSDCFRANLVREGLLW